METNEALKKDIYFFEDEIHCIKSIFDVTHQLMEDLQNSFIDIKEEREKTNIELRNNLAKNNSLRKKDFDKMVHDLLLIQEESEREIRNLVKVYIDEQKELMRSLIENLGKYKNSVNGDGVQEIKELNDVLRKIISKQDEKKETVTSKLKEFQKEQHDLTSQFKQFLTRGNELRLKDFKIMLREFQKEKAKRFALRKERKESVAKMLSAFKSQRQRVNVRIKNTNENSKENSYMPQSAYGNDGTNLPPEEENKSIKI